MMPACHWHWTGDCPSWLSGPPSVELEARVWTVISSRREGVCHQHWKWCTLIFSKLWIKSSFLKNSEFPSSPSNHQPLALKNFYKLLVCVAWGSCETAECQESMKLQVPNCSPIYNSTQGHHLFWITPWFHVAPKLPTAWSESGVSHCLCCWLRDEPLPGFRSWHTALCTCSLAWKGSILGVKDLLYSGCFGSGKEEWLGKWKGRSILKHHIQLIGQRSSEE